MKELTRSEKRKYIQRQLTVDDRMYVVNDYSADENVIDIDEDYDTMFPPTKRRWNGLVLGACMRKARVVFDNFPISVLREWSQ